MVLERWDPFKELRRIEGAMNRRWRGFGVGGPIVRWAVPLDVVQDDDSIVVHASLPGVKPEDIQVTIEDGVLTIGNEAKSEHKEGNGNYLLRERRSGRFQRTLRLPDTVDTEKAEPHYENGVVTITFPKVESKKAKRLEIKASA